MGRALLLPEVKKSMTLGNDMWGGKNCLLNPGSRENGKSGHCLRNKNCSEIELGDDIIWL